jgi:ABC-type phosphate transport system substrate-binding protein
VRGGEATRACVEEIAQEMEHQQEVLNVMTSLSARRVLSACIVSVAAAAAMAAPGVASATTDLGEQCSGANIKGLGSTFQAPAQEVWSPSFNTSANEKACSGSQGSKGTPSAKYEQGEPERGSGACLKDFGVGATPKYNEFPFCGTDEAPSESQKTEIESHETGAEAKSLENIPVTQGSVAVIVHLPEGCKAETEVHVGTTTKSKLYKLGRLAFLDSTVEGIYRGTLRNWKQVVEAQPGATMTCTGGAAEEETPISVVVRLDKSGTTHIFKSYLAQVNTTPFEAEEFNEPEKGKENACKKVLPPERKTWEDVQEGCENQRWPLAAKVVRPTEAGNPGVVNTVNTKASSVGYADIAVARKMKFFSAKGLGGENKKGKETKVGEQNTRFWAEVQDSSDEASPILYADPATNGDVEKVANSNCAATVYAAKKGEKFPPKSTRDPWFAVKAELVQKKYPICGLTYVLALRQYAKYTPQASKAQATTVENYILFALSPKIGGGGNLLKNEDYQKLSGTVLKEAETGVKEIGWEVG